MTLRTQPLRLQRRLRVASPVRLAAFFCAAFAPLLHAQTTTVFTSSATIAATNAAYDGQNIIVSNCSVVIDGQHSFANVQAISNAVLSYAAATNVNVQGMTVDGSSALYLCGGLAFNVGGTLVATNNSTVICQGTNTIAQVSNQWAGVGVTITAGNVSLAAGAAISADGQGYASGNGGGAGPGGGEGGAGAGSYGGLGSGPSGPTYGNAMAPLDLGSAGWVGSQGGGRSSWSCPATSWSMAASAPTEQAARMALRAAQFISSPEG